ncbi:DNA repair protein RecO [Novosphingobium panipatense]|jgi:DNA repair protein RecO (recombination protein O)|uniref:DNA replication and repair protein RecO n=1 Tax=Novosphingobium panipatense TaxID=428991 RepID=A0ABY1Q011_9SPHN|nr:MULTISPECIES: recombination protein O N-terminal domain-containing protein [Novosphingobium]SMP53106.1 DNA replication and repair protein RecO [Novosphingobium panipatense]
MHFRAPAIVCAALPHGEAAVVARLLTAEHGLVGAYVAGGRGRLLRPVLIPGNTVDAELRSRSDTQLPFARVELLQSRAPWLAEPLPAAAISWSTALAASVLPERQAFPALFEALSGLLQAVCVAPSARGWAMGLLRYEVLVLRELGYGARVARPPDGDWGALLEAFDRVGRELARYALADRRRDVMAARVLLRERLGRIGS